MTSRTLRGIGWLHKILALGLVAAGLRVCGCAPALPPAEAERVYAHVVKLAVDIGSRPMGSENNRLAGQYIFDTFSGYGLSDVYFQEFTSIVGDGRNVVGTVAGTTYSDWLILVGAHYDSSDVTVGASDNASGVATLLELACFFSQNAPAYTMRFVAFDGEEIGGVGSWIYHEESVLDGEVDRTLVMMNLDMTQSSEFGTAVPLIFFVLSPNPAMIEAFNEAKTQMGLAGANVHFVLPELASQVAGGELRGDVDHWSDGSALIAWPWAFSTEAYYDAVPGSIDQVDPYGLALATELSLDFLRGLQSNAPYELGANAAGGFLAEKDGGRVVSGQE